MEDKEPKALMNIRIQDSLKEKFKIKTIQEKTTMSEVITEAIKKYLEK